MDYGKKLVDLRDEKEVTQKEVANALNIKRSTYNQYEHQYDVIPTERLNLAANFFGTSIDYILGLSDKRTYDNSNVEINLEVSRKRLKEFRKNNYLTQIDLSNILKSSQHVIVYYEQGKSFISVPYLYTICKKFHLSADYLLGKIDNPNI